MQVQVACVVPVTTGQYRVLLYPQMNRALTVNCNYASGEGFTVPDSNVQPDTSVWDLPKLIKAFGRFYDIFPAGQVLCAYRTGPEGRDWPVLRAMTESGLARMILDDLIPRVPPARQAS